MWDRNARTEALLKERIATVVLEKLADPRLGFVTITAVKLSGDKRRARVFYTVLGTPAQQRLSGRALEDAARHIQEIIGKGLRIKTIPELVFTWDESVEKESKMRELLDQLAQERGDPPPSP